MINEILISRELWFAIGTGIVTSVIFLLLTFFLRPRIKISPIIVRYNTRDGFDYKIKILNCSRLFKIIDVHVELCALTYNGAPGGRNTKIDTIEMKKDHIWYVSKRNLFFQKDDSAPYAVLFTTNEDISDCLKNNGTLSFKVIAKHGLSGFPKVKTIKYHDPGDIKSGKFQFGFSMKVIETTK